MILALDTATKTGWCLLKDGKVYESGVQDFTKKRGESNGLMYLRFRFWLKVILLNPTVKSVVDIGLVVYEQAHHRGGSATDIGVNLTGRIEEMCAEARIECASVHSSTLKKWATGKGNAQKPEMITFANKHALHVVTDDNEADAICLALYAYAEFGVD